MSYIIAILITVSLIALDQASKYFVVKYLFPVGTFNLIQGVFSLTYVENTGAAFGVFEGGRWFFIILSVIIITGICVYYVSLPKGKVYSILRASLVLVVSGAVGNFIDRARQGYVVDFFHVIFFDFPVFNIADICIVTGTITLAILIIFFVKIEPSPKKETLK